MQEINSGAFSHDFFDLQHTASTPTSASPCRRASPPSSVTSPTSPPPKHLFLRRAFAKQLCRKTFGKTTITSLRQRDGMRGFIDTFIVYNKIAYVKQLLPYGSRTSVDTLDTKFYNTFVDVYIGKLASEHLIPLLQLRRLHQASLRTWSRTPAKRG